MGGRDVVAPKAPTREAILDRARAMVPKLRTRALETDRNRAVPIETHRAFEAAGFYKLFQPARYGGYEMPIGLMVEVAGGFGRGCGSGAWIFTKPAAPNWVNGVPQAAAREDVSGRKPNPLAPSPFPDRAARGARPTAGW